MSNEEDARLHRATWAAFLAGAEWGRNHEQTVAKLKADGNPNAECDATTIAGCAFDVFERQLKDFTEGVL